MLQRLELIVSG